MNIESNFEDIMDKVKKMSADLVRNEKFRERYNLKPEEMKFFFDVVSRIPALLSSSMSEREESRFALSSLQEKLTSQDDSSVQEQLNALFESIHTQAALEEQLFLLMHNDGMDQVLVH